MKKIILFALCLLLVGCASKSNNSSKISEINSEKNMYIEIIDDYYYSLSNRL